MRNILTSSALLLAASAFVACGGDDVPAVETPKGVLYLATSITASNTTSNVLLTTASYAQGTLSPAGQGLLNDGASQWINYNNDYLFAIQYNQANAGLSRSYVLGSDGKLKARSGEYAIKRFTTHGVYGSYVITAATADGPKQLADANGYLPKVFDFTWIDAKSEQLTNSAFENKYLSENFLGNGEYVMLAGLLEANNRLYTAPIAMGLSQYGTKAEGGKYIRPGFEDLVKKTSGGSKSSAYKKDELQWTQYPNEAWVAIFDNEKLDGKRLLRTDKISYACGRFKSQYYQTIWAADNGDVYVFSPSFAKTMEDPRQKTTLPAGVVRIKKGATDFDLNYYYNLEAQSGGLSFQRVFPIAGDYFLLFMYGEPLKTRDDLPTRLAVFDAAKGKLTWVSGTPDPKTVTSLGSQIHAEGGKAYVAISTNNGYPAIYTIDPASATATRGLEVKATSIGGLGRLHPRN